MAESKNPPIYQQLAEFQSGEGCEQHELRAELNRFALLFVDQFRLDIVEFVVGIDHLRRNRLGQFRRDANALGLLERRLFSLLITSFNRLNAVKSGEYSERCFMS